MYKVMKIIVFLTLININLSAITFNCKDTKVNIDIYEKYIIIDNTYKAYYVENCIDGTGGDDCTVYKNKSYTYTLFGIDDVYLLFISNIYGKAEECKEF